MKVTLKRLNQHVHFEGANAQGNTISIDGSPTIGGEDKGMRPMELVLAAVGGCSGIDVVTMLKKMKQEVDDIQLVIEGERDEEKVPAVFKKINLHFLVKGNVNPEKVQRAIQLSVEKYCSVSKMLQSTVEITASFELI